MRLFVSAADASGDLHAAAVIEALRQQAPDTSVFGLGGDALELAGLEPVVRQSELAIAGLVEVLPSAPRILRAYVALRRALRRRGPDLALLVDSPDLNLPLASVARRSRIPVLYYIAPQVWAWRRGRLRKLRRRVDHMGVIFRFEEQLFRAAGVPATFLGHPLVDRMAEVRARLQPGEVAAELGLEAGRPVLGLLPGSRRNELGANLPRMLEAARLLRQAMPELQVRLLLAPTLADEPLELPGFVHAVRGRTHAAMAISTALIVAPGTVTVEAALLGVPFVVMHRTNAVSFELARRVVRVPSSCMVNLLAGEGVVPEFLQAHARPAAVAAAVVELLGDTEARGRMLGDLARVSQGLGQPDGRAAKRAAELILEVVKA